MGSDTYRLTLLLENRLAKYEPTREQQQIDYRVCADAPMGLRDPGTGAHVQYT